MADNKILPGPSNGNHNFKEAVCVNISKIYDTCRDKDCFENLRVYLTRCSQSILDRAINVKAKSAEVIWVYIDVEPVPFNRGFYTVDIKFFFKVTFDAFLGVGRPHEIEGLCTADKKVILFGSEGNTKIFSSKVQVGARDHSLSFKTNMPKASVELVDPIALATKVVDRCEHCSCVGDLDVNSVPEFISRCFEDEIVDSDERRLFVTLGLFSIVRIERKVQLLIPACDFCIPEKECVNTQDDPCNIFGKIKFPTDEFFPPVFGSLEGAGNPFDFDSDFCCKK